MNGGARGKFVGRADELALLDESFTAARAGHPRVVVVEGEPGIGKTALLRQAVRLAPDASVVWASGDPVEAALEGGMARQLLAGWPAPGPAAAGGDSLALGAALLAGIGAAEEQAPAVVVVVDDLHWADLASAQALLFCLRRLRADTVLILLAARPHSLERLGESWARLLADAERVRWIRLAGLAPPQVQALAAASGWELTAESGARLQEHTAGNPLYVLALLTELPSDAFHDGVARLPAPHSYTTAVLNRLARLSGPARELVCAAAVLGVRGAVRVACAMAGLTDGTAAVDEAVTTHLLDLPPGGAADELAFAHPLMRAAVYEDLSPGVRRRLHLAAARLLPAPASFAHRVAAAVGGFDDRLAADLIEAAVTAQKAGTLRQAARYLAWSARVDGDSGRGERSLFDAVRLMLMAGDVHAAQEHADAVAARPPGLRRRFTLAILAVSQGWLEHAAAELRSLAQMVSPDEDAALFGYCTSALAMVCASLGEDEASLRWAERARAVAGRVPDANALALQARAWSYAKTGRIDESLRPLAGCSSRKPDPTAFDAELLTVRGVVRNWAGDFPGAIEDLQAVLRWQRSGVSITGVTNAYSALAEAEFRVGDWDAAATHVELAISLGEDLGHMWYLAYGRCVAAHLCAARGHEAFAAAHAAAAQDAAQAAPSMEALACAALARAHHAWMRSDWPTVVAALAPVDAGACGAAANYPNLALWRYRLAEAYLAEGRLTEAHRLLDQIPVAPWGGTTSADRARLDGLAWQRSGRPDRAAASFAAAMPAASSRSLADGLLALDYGRLLLHSRKRKQAAAALLTGRSILARLGAMHLTDACDQVLLACGVPAPSGTEGDPGWYRLDTLTAREQVVARLVASGMTNREVAGKLYVSVKTIEYHLGIIFAKLDIRSRRQLPAELSAGLSGLPR
jgi:DNA-binding CsgD family transcriptional regulator/tetratricopeptide (TPR) repeat protein